METQTQPQARPRRRGIYLLPNLLTTGCLFSGFYAVVAAIDQHFAHAGMGVFAAMIFDTLDGTPGAGAGDAWACSRLKDHGETP